MNRKTLAASLALLLAGGYVFAQTGAAPAPGQLSTTDVIQRVEAAGYADIRDVELDDGLWEVTATAADGRRMEVHVDPATGAVIDSRTRPALSAADVAARLQAEGYSNIRDIEYDDGRYEVEATNARGEPVDLKVDQTDGRILRERYDD